MATLTVHKYATPAEFSEAAFPFLERHEAAHNIFFGVTGDAIDYPRRYPHDNLFVTVESNEGVQLAMMQTPPHMLILSKSEHDAALRRAARAIVDSGRTIPGILSAPSEAELFGEVFERQTGNQMRIESRQRIYQATRVDPPDGVEGRYRAGGLEERELLVDWVTAFEREAIGRDEPGLRDEVANKVSDFLRAGRVGVWEHAGDVVSMAAAIGPTPHGIRVAYVYTPPEHRNHGYASACTAELTRRQFDAGRDFCFLFTDLDNPTSNHIYQAIGYEPVSDMNVYEVVG